MHSSRPSRANSPPARVAGCRGGLRGPAASLPGSAGSSCVTCDCERTRPGSGGFSLTPWEPSGKHDAAASCAWTRSRRRRGWRRSPWPSAPRSSAPAARQRAAVHGPAAVALARAARPAIRRRRTRHRPLHPAARSRRLRRLGRRVPDRHLHPGPAGAGDGQRRNARLRGLDLARRGPGEPPSPLPGRRRDGHPGAVRELRNAVGPARLHRHRTPGILDPGRSPMSSAHLEAWSDMVCTFAGPPAAARGRLRAAPAGRTLNARAPAHGRRPACGVLSVN